MNIDFTSKKALVLAGSQGLGKQVAKQLAVNGAKVVICARNSETLFSAANEIGAIPIQTDLSIPNNVESLVEEAQRQLGGIDILVTNTGGPPKTNVTDADLTQWVESFNSIFLSASIAARMVAGEMVKRKSGRIIFMSSIASKEPVPGLVLSNSLRAALLSFSKTLSNELAHTGVTVNCVLPGYIHTKRLGELGLDLNRLADSIPMKRLGRSEEFANVVSFLASDLASYITGQAISVDGGMTKAMI